MVTVNAPWLAEKEEDEKLRRNQEGSLGKLYKAAVSTEQSCACYESWGNGGRERKERRGLNFGVTEREGSEPGGNSRSTS
jgi:hypothetical protein